jgi:hypothetical protein
MSKEKVSDVEVGKVKTMLLPVPLQQDEVRARSKMMCSLIADQRIAREELEAHLKNAKSGKEDIEGRMSTLAMRISECARVVQDEREDREIPVYEEIDYKRETVFTKRQDTDEVVSSRGLTEAERQRSLFKDKQKAAGKEAGAQA